MSISDNDLTVKVNNITVDLCTLLPCIFVQGVSIEDLIQKAEWAWVDVYPNTAQIDNFNKGSSNG